MSKRTSLHSHARTRSGRFRAAPLIGLAAVVAITVSGCGGDGEDGDQQAQSDVQPIAKEELLKLPEATTFGDIEGAPKDPAPTEPTDGAVVQVTEEVPVYDDKGGEPFARMPAKQLGSPTWLAVLDQQDDWFQVLLPSRPNASTGWLHNDNGVLETAENDFLVEVDTADFSMTLTEAGNEVGSWEIGTGTEEHPTPTGRAAIISSLEESVKDYSPLVLPLSSHSDSHETYGGGPGTVGIHGWPDDSVMGTETSDGCIRVPADALEKLSTVPLGTVVLVS
ncbi:lipoprotein-anchoring transpeptidase ErfK/SrfK [Tamaricihabitans halophyticus]|uniref:Lipoprotein-anchoring transpeptidase ErfK/SrfK n=1 Tax=Tamaricihabitans halophyticus TaxID=1262583 RepID=A0A4R2R3A8_9PSEU|nr:L,D-transpeptidase [Tamaricihabitans halophyticus]TCP56507.1 lipoprotein-anchoring transpeptidase ErfK/SrfK [Tamaricihabitans halophyticus]